jgi:glycerate kinase
MTASPLSPVPTAETTLTDRAPGQPCGAANRAPKIVIAPDSFKGSLSAADVAAAIAAGVRRVLPNAEIQCCPMADGGEGTLDALITGAARRISVDAADAAAVWRDLGTGEVAGTPRADARRAVPVALLGDGGALIESASIVGITDPDGMAAPVEHRSTTGIGHALLALLDRLPDAPGEPPLDRVYIALGGSSTNDGGAGMLQALGARLLDADGRDIPPCPSAFHRLTQIDLTALDARLTRVRLIAMSDVDNPLCGEQGATAVFGPQKGVRADQVAALDQALARFADCLEAAHGQSARERPGAGAAGGLGYALLILGAAMEPGAEVVAKQVGLDAALAGADWLFTGEGRSDAQTLRGKAPFVACRHARALGVPTTLLSGAVDRAALKALSEHFNGCVAIAPGPMTLEDAIDAAAELLADAAEQLSRIRYGR